MRLVLLVALAASPSLAAGYNPKDAAACYVYAVAAKKPDIAASVRRLASAYRSEHLLNAQGEAFIAKINRTAARSQAAGAQQLVGEGRAGCASIGVM